MAHEIRINDNRDVCIGQFSGYVPRMGEEVRTFDDNQQAQAWEVVKVVWWISPLEKHGDVMRLREIRAVVYVKKI